MSRENKKRLCSEKGIGGAPVYIKDSVFVYEGGQSGCPGIYIDIS